MRDKIKMECKNLRWDIREMTKEEVVKQFDITIQDVEGWIESLMVN